MANLDKDARKLATKSGGLLVGIGGITMGAIAAGFGGGVVDGIMESLGIENEWLREGLVLLAGGALMALAGSFRNAVSNQILKAIFGFLVMFAVGFLLVRIIRDVYNFFTHGTISGATSGGV